MLLFVIQLLATKQWGLLFKDSYNYHQTVNLPIAYSNNKYVAISTPGVIQNTDDGKSVMATIRDKTATNFVLRITAKSSSAISTDETSWITLGK